MSTGISEYIRKEATDHKQYVQKHCDAFLNKHKIDFFSYLRCYDNGSCFFITTHPELYDFLFHHQFPLTPNLPPELQAREKIFYIVPESGSYQSAMDGVAKHFELYKPIDFIYRHKKFYEMYCYGIHAQDENKINYYLNHLNDFENFNLNFKKHSQPIFEDLDRKRLLLTDEMFLSAKPLLMGNPAETDILLNNTAQQKILLNKEIIINNNLLSLTTREQECLVALLNGKTAKETAKMLSLSHRTVEIYLENLKRKTASVSKVDLLNKVYAAYHDERI